MSSDIFLTSEDVAEIVAILDGSPYERLDVRTSRFALRVARSGEGWSQEWTWSEEGPPGIPTSPSRAAEHVDEDVEEGVTAIKAPLPGTFFRSPQPGAPPFVKIGDRVEPDTVVAIIEAMKVMTALPAHCAGTVEAVLVDDGALVGANATIMRVRADR